MDQKKITETNREAWNQAIEYHKRARQDSLKKGFSDPNFTTFNRECDIMMIEKIKSISLSGKTIAHIQCGNGNELLSLMRLGASKGVGFDISDTAITEAGKLAKIAKANATFERVNILEISDKYNGYFDFIFISEGSLIWFPDINEYFAVVSRLLKPGGHVLIFELHPFALIFDNGFEFEKQNFDDLVSYFNKTPYNHPDGLDYVGGVKYKSKTCLCFMHKMSDIITAILKNGISIKEFDEYNYDSVYNDTEKVNGKFPLTFLIIGKKPNNLK